VEKVAQDAVIDPVDREVAAYEELRTALSRLRS
jgi:hypothetical protein